MSLNSVRMLCMDSVHSTNKVKPDGGWGWVVVFASLMISVIGDGYTYTTGQFYEQFLVQFKQSETVTSLYISVMTGTILCISPFASGMIQIYGCRFVSILGSFLAVTGIILCTIFDGSVFYHCITIGLITGSGLGLLFITQVIVVTFWFDKKLALATGIAECGSGFGMAIFALISDYFIKTYTWKGAMIILGGLMSTCIAFSAIYCEPTVDIRLNVWKDMFSFRPFVCALKETINFNLLVTNKQFVLFTISNAVLSSVFFVPIVVTSDRIKRSNLDPHSNGAALYVCFGLANGAGRILFGWIATVKATNRLWLYVMCTILLGIFVMLTTLAKSMLAMELLYIGIGIFFGANVCLCPVVLIDMLGVNKVSNAYGIVSFFDGVGALLGPPLLNLSVKKPTDLPHSDIYTVTILISGIIAVLSALILLPMQCIRNPYENKDTIPVKVESSFRSWVREGAIGPNCTEAQNVDNSFNNDNINDDDDPYSLPQPAPLLASNQVAANNRRYSDKLLVGKIN